MGIDTFNFWIRRLRIVNVSRTCSSVLSLLIDANGILHTARNYVTASDRTLFSNDQEYENRKKALAKIKRKQLIDEMLMVIVEILNFLINEYKPSKTVVISVDGVAPFAKITQQRTRRYIASLKDTTVVSPIEITPGTELMKSIDKKIVDWIRSSDFPCEKVIYSSYAVKGEGEHKIIDLIRKGEIEDGNGYHIIFSKDSDLNILSLLSPFRDKIVVSQESVDGFISIKQFTDYLAEKMGSGTNLTKENIVADFVLLITFLGNDFLPKLFAFTDVETSVSYLICLYNAVFVKKICTRPLVNIENYKINWRSLKSLLRVMSSHEHELLIKKSKINFRFGSELLYLVENYETFRKHWYLKEQEPKTSTGKVICSPTEPDADDIERMSKLYLYGLQWVMSYYSGRGTDGFVYSYYRAPLIRDLYHHCGEPEFDFPDVKLEIPHQLVAVIPPSHSSIIGKLAPLIEPGGKLEPFAPINFQIENEARHNDFHQVPLIPFINPLLLIKAVGKVKKTDKENIVVKKERKDEFIAVREEIRLFFTRKT
ncbi:MAG: hypothetical protein KatS3mg101_0846 [Patescibacteria group bacterium]|nr:MAG: hypothetical protein KatS3mg101_0846 [Patescibacteria group bacterium]